MQLSQHLFGWNTEANSHTAKTKGNRLLVLKANKITFFMKGRVILGLKQNLLGHYP